MTAIDNVRRDLREHSWLRYSDKPFAGAIHNFSRPLKERLKAREYCGPYYWSPAKSGGGRGFYQHSTRLECGDGTFSLRLELANDHLQGCLSHIEGYFTNKYQDETFQPIVARLPHGRGFLAGWTMGCGMIANIDLYMLDSIEDAARAAHYMAESDAEKEWEYQSNQTDE